MVGQSSFKTFEFNYNKRKNVSEIVKMSLQRGKERGKNLDQPIQNKKSEVKFGLQVNEILQAVKSNRSSKNYSLQKFEFQIQAMRFQKDSKNFEFK